VQNFNFPVLHAHNSWDANDQTYLSSRSNLLNRSGWDDLRRGFCRSKMSTETVNRWVGFQPTPIGAPMAVGLSPSAIGNIMISTTPKVIILLLMPMFSLLGFITS
jgi:hypothetical protein